MKAKVNNSWVDIPEIYTKVSGDWKYVLSGYTKVNGAWKEIYQSCPYDAQIEYLESTGTQWIDSEVLFASGLRVICDAQYTNNYTSTQVLFGASASGGCWCGNVSNTKWGVSATGVGNSSLKTNIEVFYDGSTTRLYIDGTQLSTQSRSITPSANIGIFDATSLGFKSYARIYRIIIQDSSNNILFYGVPVRKGLVGYLYDKISGKLFGNSGTGSFALGSDIIPIEYILNTGTSYINTLYKPNQNTRVTCDMQIVTSTDYQRLFGCVGGTSYNTTPNYVMNYETGATGSLQILMGSDTSWKNTGVTGDYNRHTYDWNKTQIYRDGTLVYTHSAVTFQCTTNLAIFSYMKSNGITTDSAEYMLGKCYSFKIYENDVLVRDYIPVRAGSTGYLYDKVNDRLYGNSGAGSFTLGPDVT